ncbi:hypothetical protein [Ureibacillus chungkukjangi]|uniref:hypothetical protein n=1 Tax=Ureibacillus chungkukjangi TaxID=1202712 RepID=UPI000D3BDA5F|nr:hypothetical protein [Ureibacillus chungkukjangi]
MSIKNRNLTFKNLQNFLHNINEKRLRELLEQYQMKPELSGSKKNYIISECTQLKKDLEARYDFNRKNRIETKELISLGIPNPSTIFKKIKKEPLDRIYEFKSSTYFYDRKELEIFLCERQTIKDSFSIDDIQKELGLTYYKITKEIIQTLKLVPIRLKYFDKLTYFNVEHVKEVIDLIQTKYEFNKENRLTSEQISKYYNLSVIDISKLNPIKTTALDRVNEFYNCNYFYIKQEVINYEEQAEEPYETYSTKEALAILKPRTRVNYFSYLNRLNIFPVNTGTPPYKWSKEEIDELAERKKILLDIYTNKFLNISEFVEYFSVDFNFVQRAFDRIGEEIKIYKVPEEVRIDNSKKFYKKFHLLACEDLNYILEVVINDSKIINRNEVLKKKEDFFIKNNINDLSLNPERERGFKFLLLESDDETIEDFLKYTGIPDFRNLEKEIEKLMTTKESSSKYIISKDQILEKYNISFILFKDLLDMWNSNNKQIQYIKKSYLTFYSLKDIETLFAKLIYSQTKLLEEYYTNDGVYELGLKYHQVASKDTIEVPSHLKFGIFSMKSMLYPKIEVHKTMQELKLKDFLYSYKNHDELLLMPSKLFDEIIETLKVKFNMCNFKNSTNQTVTYWNQYVKKSLNSSHANKAGVYKLLIKFVRLTDWVSKFSEEKDIYERTIDEIKTFIHQNEIPKTWCTSLMTFLLFVNAKRITKYKIDEVKELLRKSKVVETPRETDVYTNQEFIELINYVSDVSYHKNETLKELTKSKSGKRIYYEYSSVWLYVLMHINNAWRSNDIIEKVPRISLPRSIDSIEKFHNYELSSEEKKSILLEMSGKLFNVHHNKNLKQAYFFCAEKLEEPFVNAAVLCELKCRLERPLENNLIKLDDNNYLGKTLHRSFFKNFKIQHFTFESLKTNRTYLKTLKSILNHLNSSSVMTILELQRNHSSQDVTKRYTPISTEEANHILKNLNSVGYFGYTYTLLTNVLLGKQGAKVTTTSTLLLKEVFGDIYKVENFITQINSIEQANLDIVTYLEKLTKNELENLYGLISLGQKPAKEEHWQCILGDCIYLDKNCENCPFSIPNYYALDSLLKKIIKHITDYEKYFEHNIKYELIKSSKLIHRYLLLLSAAKKKFGENAISSFLGYDYTVLKDKLSGLHDFNYYLYLREDTHE